MAQHLLVQVRIKAYNNTPNCTNLA